MYLIWRVSSDTWSWTRIQWKTTRCCVWDAHLHSTRVRPNPNRVVGPARTLQCDPIQRAHSVFVGSAKHSESSSAEKRMGGEEKLEHSPVSTDVSQATE